MIKVSFKNTPNNPNKTIIKQGNQTTVLLECTFVIPEPLRGMIGMILNLADSYSGIYLRNYNKENLKIHIIASGKSRCHPDDHYNSVLGERLAESKARLCVYKYILAICRKLVAHYTGILFGEDSIFHSESKNGLCGDLKRYYDLYMREKAYYCKLLNSHE